MYSLPRQDSDGSDRARVLGFRALDVELGRWHMLAIHEDVC